MQKATLLLIWILFLSVSHRAQLSERSLDDIFTDVVASQFPKHKLQTIQGPSGIHPSGLQQMMIGSWKKRKLEGISIVAYITDTPEEVEKRRNHFLTRSIMPRGGPVRSLGENAIYLSTCTFVDIAFLKENVFVNLHYSFVSDCPKTVPQWTAAGPAKEIARATRLAEAIYFSITRRRSMTPCNNTLVNTYSPRPTNDQERMLEAAFNGNTDVIKSLLTKGVPVSVTDVDGNTPLHLAVRHGCVDTIQTLIHSKADVNARNKRGRTPLMVAVDLRVSDAVRILLDAGADPAIEDEHGVNTARITAYGRSIYTMFPQPEENIVEIRKLLEARGVTPSELFINRNRTTNN